MTDDTSLATIQREIGRAKSVHSELAGLLSHLDCLLQQRIDEEGPCPIRRESFSDPMRTPCNHVFCDQCITPWLSPAQ